MSSRRSSSWISAALLAVAASLPAGAHADAISPDYRPRQCPPGSWGSFPHGSGPCQAHPCQDDIECFGNQCRETGLCLEGTLVQGPCGAQGECPRGQCVTARRCAPREAPSAGDSTPLDQAKPDARGGCGCRVLDPRSGLEGLGLLLLLGLLVALRRA